MFLFLSYKILIFFFCAPSPNVLSALRFCAKNILNVFGVTRTDDDVGNIKFLNRSRGSGVLKINFCIWFYIRRWQFDGNNLCLQLKLYVIWSINSRLHTQRVTHLSRLLAQRVTHIKKFMCLSLNTQIKIKNVAHQYNSYSKMMMIYIYIYILKCKEI